MELDVFKEELNGVLTMDGDAPEDGEITDAPADPWSLIMLFSAPCIRASVFFVYIHSRVYVALT